MKWLATWVIFFNQIRLFLQKKLFKWPYSLNLLKTLKYPLILSIYNFVQFTSSRSRRWIVLFYDVFVLSKRFTCLTHSAWSWTSWDSSIEKPFWLSTRVSFIYIVQICSMNKLVTKLFHSNRQFFVIKSIRSLCRFKAINTLLWSNVLLNSAI